MNNKVLKLTILFLILAPMVFGGCYLIGNISLGSKGPQSFAVSGYVMADGQPLKDATVSCGIMETTTNELGYYRFDGLNNVVRISATKDGYFFDIGMLNINTTTSDVNFLAYKYYDINGVVKNGNKVVPNATLKAYGKTGTFLTSSNDQGEFYFPRLAGTFNISVINNELDFFEKNIDIKNTDIIINTTTKLMGNIIADFDILPNDVSLKLNGQSVVINEDMTFSIENIKTNDVLTLESDDYFIKNNTIIINDENQDIRFDLQKYYDLNIQVSSGDVILDDAKVLLDNREINQSQKVLKLYGEHKITAKLDGYNFDTIITDNHNNDIKLIGSFDLKGKINIDFGDVTTIKICCGEQNIKANSLGEFYFKNIQLNNTIYIDSDLYYVKNNNIKINNTNEIQFDLQKYYDVQFNVESETLPLGNVKFEYNGEIYSSDKKGTLNINKLYGEQIFLPLLDGYHFDEVTVNYVYKNKNIVAKKMFDVSGCVKSGDIILNNATIEYNKNIIQVDEMGKFVLANMYQSGEISIKCPGYNDNTIIFDKDNNNLDITLTYDIDGKIICGDIPVKDVLVLCGNQKVYTNIDGGFVINNLSGSNNITLNKDYYNFDKLDSVNKNMSLNISSSYKIVGQLTNSFGMIKDFAVFATNINTGELKKTLTNESGNYVFDNLIGEYFVYYDPNINISLKPLSYDVLSGGVCNFSDKGYGFAGRIMCGNMPVSDVKLVAGDKVAYTDELGCYKFDLLTKSTILNLSKEGYTFVNNNIEVNDEFDGRENIDFDCSYAISGQVLSGVTPLKNVSVIVKNSNLCKSVLTDEFGRYKIDGLINEVNVEYSLDGYKFVGSTSINQAVENNIQGLFDAKLCIKTGDVLVKDVECCINKNVIRANSNGIIELFDLKIGDKCTFNKKGYVVDEMVFDELPTTIVEIHSKYNIKGQVKSGENGLNNVKIFNQDIQCFTNELGEFELNNLIGANVFSVVLDGYEFDDLMINSANDNYIVCAKYTVTGIVKVGKKPLPGVKVQYENLSTNTDIDGLFVLNGLTTVGELSFNKTGYVFSGNMLVNGPTKLDINASFCIKGVVRSGDIKIPDVKVTATNGVNTVSDIDGNFELVGIDDMVDLTFEKEGYNLGKYAKVDSYRDDININMSYQVEINFDGVYDYNDIQIKLNNFERNYSGQNIKLDNLFGENTIEFFKDKYTFNPQKYIVSEYSIINVNVKMVYSISGNVNVSGANISVCGAKITAGDNVTYTDENGDFTFDKLNKPVVVNLSLDIGGADNTKSVFNMTYGTVTGTNNACNFDITNDVYAYYMFKRSFDYLDRALSYQIYCDGVVTPDVGGAQSVTTIYKKDINNIRLVESINFGKAVMGVDPMVGLLTCVDLNNDSVRYKRVDDQGSVKKISDKAYEAIYSDNWEQSSMAEYASRGLNPKGYYPYNIDMDTITKDSVLKGNISSFSTILYDTNTQEYSFTINLNVGKKETYAQYQKQMKYMVSEQSLEKFDSITLNCKFDKNGFIKEMETKEIYRVHADSFSSVSVKTESTLTYHFLTRSLNERIPEFCLDTNSQVQQSLKRSPVSVNSITNQSSVELYRKEGEY